MRSGAIPPRWVIVVSLAVAAAILGDSLLYAVLPVMGTSLGLSVEAVGLVLSVNRLVRLISNPIAGWVVGRQGMRGPFLVAVFIGGLTTASYAWGLGLGLLLAARAGWGISWSFLRLGGYLAALEAASPHQRGYYLGFFSGVTRVGSFVAALAGGLLTDLVGFVATAWLFAGITTAGGLALLRERPLVAAEFVPTGTPTVASGVAGGAVITARRRRWRVATLFAVVFLLGLAVSGLVQATLGRWIVLRYGPEPSVLWVVVGATSLSGSLLAVRFLADVVIGPLAGHLADRFGRRRLALLTGSVVAGAMFWLASADLVVGTIASAVLLYLVTPGLQATLDALAGDLAPPAGRARLLGWYANWADLGWAAGPLLGYLSGIDLASLYRIGAGLLLLAGVVFTFVFADAPNRPHR